MLKNAIPFLLLLGFITSTKAPCIVTTIQKCGTHVFSRAISALIGVENRGTPKMLLRSTRQGDNFYPHTNDLAKCIEIPNTLIFGHFPYDQEITSVIEAYDMKVLLLLRHPADQAVSFARCAYEPHSYLGIHAHRTLNENITAHITTNELLYATKEDSFYPSGTSNISELFEAYLKWAEKPYVLLIRYEDFVGGKENSLRQRCNTLSQIAKFLDLDITEKKILEIAQAIDDSAFDTTFRPGKKIGRWKEYFNSENITLLDKVAGNLIQKLGYNLD